MNLREKILKELIKSKIKSGEELNFFKRKIAEKYKIPCPSNFQLLQVYQNLVKKKEIKRSKKIEEILKTRPVRSLSGIVNISVLTKPYPCPGKCIFCPIEKGMPKSYLSGEPAAERAKRLNFDPYSQMKKRIEMLKAEGHPTDKIELRIVGGTWSYYPREYQIWFVKECFRAANEFGSSKNSKLQIPNSKQISYSKFQISKLEREQKINEKAKNRIVGISIETRPDFIDEKEILRLRKLGVTMVELGVQTIFDEILKKNETGLTQEKIARATKLLKDSGFKVLYHLMLNLPGSSPELDLKNFKIVFSDERFKPDWIKIYPVVVAKGSQLYQIWKKGEYKPYSEKELIELLIKIKKNLPYWVRVARILRDIPVPKIEAGCKISNLREVVKEEMRKRGLICKCIRCREIRAKYDQKEKVYLFREDYDASDGKEIFLSFESIEADKRRLNTPINADRKLYAFLRLRIPSQILSRKMTEVRPVSTIPALKDSAIIREIQTYGEMVPIAEKKLAPQHRGLGKKLIKEAEKITKKEFGLNKIAVISGVGVRDYWRKLGYKLKETYMVKFLS
jgi:elongator complex protein 3